MSPFILLQHLIPQHLLTRIAGALADSRRPWLKNAMIEWFHQRYQVNMDEALEPDLSTYESFNEFFTRPLKPQARPLATNPEHWLSPADGQISQTGQLSGDCIVQAKGRLYSATQLLNSSRWAQEVRGGDFCTIYLSPKDYHRLHMPLDATLTDTCYVPGKLFSVNNATAEGVDALFARNERLVCRFESEHGVFFMVYVGAMIVAGISTPWNGREQSTSVPRWQAHQHHLKQGEEAGRFMLGSTVILLTAKEMADFSGWQNGDKICVHQRLNNENSEN